MTSARSVRARPLEVERVLRLLLVVNLGMVAAKAFAGWRTGSLAVLGGALDSAVDSLTSVIAVVLARVAAQEPDERHPYGHAKFETLGALVIVAFLSITVFELAQGGISRLRGGGAGHEQGGMLAIGVMTGSLVVGIVASAYEARRGRELGSDLLMADAAHLRADVLVTVAVLAGLLLQRAGFRNADAWATLLVCALIARTGWEIVREAVPVLVDERAVEAAELTAAAEAMAGVHAVYDVRSRGKHGAVFAELTIAVGRGIDVETAHEIADTVERHLQTRFGARGVIVHVEPLGRERGGGEG